MLIGACNPTLCKVFETFNERKMHIVLPVIPKLLSLVHHAAGAAPGQNNYAWVEILVLKMLRHEQRSAMTLALKLLFSLR